MARNRVIITNEALDRIREHATMPFRSEAIPAGDGRWSVPISQEVMERIREHKLKGETISETIVRICSIAKHGKN